ncbi:rna-directed dna polymerase from mobile element jockey-like [Limosa lapponica baueri]|uniref:Rna-directed dna polymerase from mobile element jockey-like n=1 Tax=Limosa lapponica baueri TaxID=1758121 RepID=A0A2I0UQZ1_LIMLA|nr:rna-directed dna polymerase from mobile element jockey-like [Limosa lapponica baueri]
MALLHAIDQQLLYDSLLSFRLLSYIQLHLQHLLGEDCGFHTHDSRCNKWRMRRRTSLRHLDDGGKCTLSKLADDTKLKGVVEMPGGLPANQRNLTRSEKWTNKDLMMFNKEKCQGLPLGRNNPRYMYVLGPPTWKATWQERIWGSWQTPS